MPECILDEIKNRINRRETVFTYTIIVQSPQRLWRIYPKDKKMFTFLTQEPNTEYFYLGPYTNKKEAFKIANYIDSLMNQDLFIFSDNMERIKQND